MDWWEIRQVHGLTVTCLPAQHFSTQSLGYESAAVEAWAVAGRMKRFFFAGDTGYYSVFKEVEPSWAPLTGGYSDRGLCSPSMMKMTHVTPEQALQILPMSGQRFVAMHWGTFDMTEELIEEPALRAKAEAGSTGSRPSRVWIMKHGETRSW